MDKIFEQCFVDGDLTPALIKRKQELDKLMEVELAEIEAGYGNMWVPKERQYADVRQKYDDIWEQELADAGYIVRPVFESIEQWYDVLSKLNENSAIRILPLSEGLLVETQKLDEGFGLFAVILTPLGFTIAHVLAVCLKGTRWQLIMWLPALAVALLSGAIAVWFQMGDTRSGMGDFSEALAKPSKLPIDLYQSAKENPKLQKAIQTVYNILGQDDGDNLLHKFEEELNQCYAQHPEMLELDPAEVEANEEQIISQLARQVQDEVARLILKSDANTLSNFSDSSLNESALSIITTVVECTAYVLITALVGIGVGVIPSPFKFLSPRSFKPFVLTYFIIATIAYFANWFRYEAGRFEEDLGGVNDFKINIDQLAKKNSNYEKHTQLMSDYLGEPTFSQFKSRLENALQEAFVTKPDLLNFDLDMFKTQGKLLAKRAAHKVERDLANNLT